MGRRARMNPERLLLAEPVSSSQWYSQRDLNAWHTSDDEQSQVLLIEEAPQLLVPTRAPVAPPQEDVDGVLDLNSRSRSAMLNLDVRSLQVRCCTWNLGGAKIPEAEKLKPLLLGLDCVAADIVAIG